LVGFGFSALVLSHEANQPPTNSNDSGDTAWKLLARGNSSPVETPRPWKLLARKGNRNVAVAAIVRRLAVQVWHLLSGDPPEALEASKSLDLKLGKPLRQPLHLPPETKDCIRHFHQMILSPTNPGTAWKRILTTCPVLRASVVEKSSVVLKVLPMTYSEGRTTNGRSLENRKPRTPE
jgi:hypothetical protein